MAQKQLKTETEIYARLMKIYVQDKNKERLMLREIDLVIPMVFPQDTEWQREYTRWRTGGSGGTAGIGAATNVRYRSWDTEELLVRCCQKFMPWVRTIHILLAGESQVQEWMTKASMASEPEVRLVFHREFMPQEALPCFASPCIEMFLHRIPGLAEHFIYSNDDVFPLSPLEESDFFRSLSLTLPKGGGNTEHPSLLGEGMGDRLLPCQTMMEVARPARPNVFERACLGQQDFIANDFGRSVGGWLKGGHCMTALLKSACEEVWQRHGDEIRQHLSPLKRSDRDFNQYLFSLYQYFAGRYVEHAPQKTLLTIGKGAEPMRMAIREAHGVVCLNDHECVSDITPYAKVVREEILAKLKAPDAPEENHNEKPIDVLIIHYNTHELTEAAIKSLWKHTPEARVTVFDNSDARPFDLRWLRGPRGGFEGFEGFDGLNDKIRVIDNTRGQHIDFEQWLATFRDKDPTNDNRYASARHCKSVDYCMDMFPDGFLLMDSDVLVKQDVTPLFDECYAWVGQVKLQGTRYGVRLPRVLPYICYINTKLLRVYGIRYCNPGKMYGLSQRKPDTAYDTGCWFHEACHKVNLTVKEIPIDDYILHLGHASWQNRDAASWLHEFRSLWQEQKDNVRIYVCTHTDFKRVVRSKTYEVVDARQWNGDRCENGLHGSFYSELITYRHIAEREDLPEFVGFCGYRKYFAFMDNVPDMDEVFSHYDAIAATPVTVLPNMIGQYDRSHNVKDLQIVSDIVRRDYPELWPVYDRSLRRTELYACNMFIVRRDDFRWIIKTVFEILDKYLAALGASGVSGEDPIERRINEHPQDYHIGQGKIGVLSYQYRIGGFLGERIVNALLRYRFKRIKCYDKVVTQGPL